MIEEPNCSLSYPVYFNHAVHVFVLVVLEQFGFVLMHDLLCNEFIAFWLAFVDDHFVVLAQLDFVILQCFSEVLVFGGLLHRVKQLKQID